MSRRGLRCSSSRLPQYPVTPTLSVEAVQLTRIELCDCAVAVTPVGMLGACVSTLQVGELPS